MPTDNLDQARLDDLEMKNAFQEQLLQDLNDVVAAQSLRITQLERQMALLIDRYKKSDDEAGRVALNPCLLYTSPSPRDS